MRMHGRVIVRAWGRGTGREAVGEPPPPECRRTDAGGGSGLAVRCSGGKAPWARVCVGRALHPMRWRMALQHGGGEAPLVVPLFPPSQPHMRSRTGARDASRRFQVLGGVARRADRERQQAARRGALPALQQLLAAVPALQRQRRPNGNGSGGQGESTSDPRESEVQAAAPPRGIRRAGGEEEGRSTHTPCRRRPPADRPRGNRRARTAPPRTGAGRQKKARLLPSIEWCPYPASV